MPDISFSPIISELILLPFPVSITKDDGIYIPGKTSNGPANADFSRVPTRLPVRIDMALLTHYKSPVPIANFLEDEQLRLELHERRCEFGNHMGEVNSNSILEEKW